MSKIHNVFIKLHQRGRRRYLALFLHILPSMSLISLKKPQKLTVLYLLSTARN